MARSDDLYIDKDSIQCGPWISTPASSRVKRFRYDYGNEVIQVQWTNNKNDGYVYDAGYEEFRGMVRAASKGKRINDPLNGYPYRPMMEEEYTAEVVRTTAPLSRSRKITGLEFD